MAEFDYESNTVGKYVMPASPHSAGEVHVSTGKAALDDAHTTNDMIGLCILPKGCIPIDFILRSDKLETVAGSAALAIVIDVGISKADKTGIASSTTIISGSTISQGGGTDNVDLTVAAAAVFVDTKAKNKDRVIAAKITTCATVTSSVSQGDAGDLLGDLYYRSVGIGEWDASPSSIA